MTYKIMKKSISSQGFTLIELLVVIAIIGILSSVVLASLNAARNKGADAAVKSNLANTRAQAEIIFDTKSCYSSDTATPCSGTAVVASPVTVTACPALGGGTSGTIFANPTINSQINTAKNASGGLYACETNATQTKWAAAVQLKSDLTKAWCVDSTGVSKQVSDPSAFTQTTLNGDITGAACGS
jgi:prepilin-type N-terminal cleavage/methylation domain-containing protein